MNHSDEPTDAGQWSWSVPPDNRADCLRRLVCPICLGGPYRAVLVHVSKMHGIDGRTMRELCAVTYSESLCDEGHSRNRRAAWFRNIQAPATGGRANSMSQAARQLAGERIGDWAAANPDKNKASSVVGGTRAAEAKWGHLPPHVCLDCKEETERRWVRCPQCRSKREARWVQVLAMKRGGSTDAEVAAALGVSRRTATKIKSVAVKNLGHWSTGGDA